MQARLLTAEQFQTLDPQVVKVTPSLVYLKLVSVGPNTLQQTEGQPLAIAEMLNGLDGYYIVAEDVRQARAAMHTFIDKMFDLLEK